MRKPPLLPILLALAVGVFAQQIELLPREKLEFKGAAPTEALLKARAERLIAGWRADPKSVDRKEALLLYWFRGPLLSEKDREYLKSLNPTTFGKVPLADTAAAAAAAGGGLAPKPPPLSVRLKASLEFEHGGNLLEALQFDLTVARMLESPTARKLAEEFLAHGRKVRVRFAEVPNSAVVEKDGRKVLDASGGNIDTSSDPMVITLNRDFLKTDASYFADYAPKTLGHELLGHGLENIKAQEAGVAATFNRYYNDEANAGLVGWIIQAERGTRLEDGNMINLLDNPQRYHARLKVSLPYYAGTFTPEEMADPLPVLERRLEDIAAEKIRIKETEIDPYETYLAAAEHFVAAHKVERGRLRAVFSRCEAQLKVSGPNSLKDADAVEAYIRGLIAHYKTPEGAKRVEAMKADSKKPFFAQMEERIEQRRRYLKTLADAAPIVLPGLTIVVEAGSPSGAVKEPPAPSAISWSEFLEAYEKDKKDNPSHYKAKP